MALIAVRPGDTLASLAQSVLGDATEIQRVVPIPEDGAPVGVLRPGGAVAVALQPRDPGGTLSRAPQKVTILCYHRFVAQPPRTPSKMEVTAASFDQQLTYLRDRGYSIIPLSRLRAFLDGRADLPPNPVVITIDDGYRSAYAVAYPVLERHRAPATLFVYSDFVGAGGALTWAQLSELQKSKLVDVQAHSKTHGDMTIKAPRETPKAYAARVRTELAAGGALARAGRDGPATALAYPYGAANKSVLDQMRGGDWRLGMTVLRGGNASWSDPLLLRREMVYGGDTLETFAKRLQGGERRP